MITSEPYFNRRIGSVWKTNYHQLFSWIKNRNPVLDEVDVLIPEDQVVLLVERELEGNRPRGLQRELSRDDRLGSWDVEHCPGLVDEDTTSLLNPGLILIQVRSSPEIGP